MTTFSALRDDLFACPENPCPAGAVRDIVWAEDGVALRVARWMPTGAPRGTVLILQGRAEFIEKYFETVDDLLERDFAVLAFDWRGQGGSARTVVEPSKGHVGDFAEYAADVAAIARHVREARLPRPVFALAHSMGGAIALGCAHSGTLPADALVALAPMIDLRLVKRPKLVRPLVAFLDGIGLGRFFVPGGNGRSISTMPFAGNRLSADPIRYARNAKVAAAIGPVAIGAPTIGWLAAAYRAMTTLQSDGHAAAIRIPVLLIGAGEDPVCLTGAAEIFAGGLSGGSGATIIPRARHELLMESGDIRRQTWAAIDAFFAEVTAATAIARSAAE